MELPSRELLSAILNKNVKRVITDIKAIHSHLNSSVKNSEIAILYDDKWTYENIYELMHLMKEWAYSNGLTIYSCLDGLGGHAMTENTNEEENDFNSNSEFEAVTKACELVLKEQK